MYPGIELRLLRYAVAVAETLSFSQAAERLNTSQPSLSRQIQKLEHDLGVKLFDRTKRWVELTPAGRAFVQEAKKRLLCFVKQFFASRWQWPFHDRVLLRENAGSTFTTLGGATDLAVEVFWPCGV